MRPEEAEWIGGWLSKAGDISPLIELGSATQRFRTVEQPHIDSLIHARLRDRGVQIVHTDLKAGEGVDISGNIYDAGVRAKLKAVGARCVLCCNIFEHVEDRTGFAAICDDILLPGGQMIVSVPHSYPYHRDPIDTYYRPKPDEIACLFPGYSTLVAKCLKCGSYWNDLDGAATIVKAIAKSAILRGGVDASKARAHRLLWLFRPYQVSVAALRKPGQAA